jgi:hypothetical protein
MTTPLLPQAFWFRLSMPCRRVDGIPKTGKGRLLDLPDSCRLPQTSALDGKPAWAEVRVAWNPAGLGIAVEATGLKEAISFDDRPEGADGVDLWIDTRDTRTINRASRFCHRFVARLREGSSKTALGVQVVPRPIARAIADAPLCRLDLLVSRAERIRGGWRLELFIPAEALNGFDPETNRRLGCAYHVSDPDREDQFLGVGRDFPLGENPSLWSTLELSDEG